MATGTSRAKPSRKPAKKPRAPLPSDWWYSYRLRKTVKSKDDPDNFYAEIRGNDQEILVIYRGPKSAQRIYPDYINNGRIGIPVIENGIVVAIHGTQFSDGREKRDCVNLYAWKANGDVVIAMPVQDQGNQDRSANLWPGTTDVSVFNTQARMPERRYCFRAEDWVLSSNIHAYKPQYWVQLISARYPGATLPNVVRREQLIRKAKKPASKPRAPKKAAAKKTRKK